MESQLTVDQRLQLVPLLGGLARLIARGTALSTGRLQTLLNGADLEQNPAALVELQRWARLLASVHDDPSPDSRQTVVETLLARGLPEATILLAIDLVARSESGLLDSLPSAPVSPRLQVQPERLEWTLPPGQATTVNLEVQGGPGQIHVDCDQVTVTPAQFGPDPTQVRVDIRPLQAGTLWTTIKVVTAETALDIPLVANWTADAPMPTVVPSAPAPDTPIHHQAMFSPPPAVVASSQVRETSVVVIPSTGNVVAPSTGNVAPVVAPATRTLRGPTLALGGGLLIILVGIAAVAQFQSAASTIPPGRSGTPAVTVHSEAAQILTPIPAVDLDATRQAQQIATLQPLQATAQALAVQATQEVLVVQATQLAGSLQDTRQTQTAVTAAQQTAAATTAAQQTAAVEAAVYQTAAAELEATRQTQIAGIATLTTQAQLAATQTAYTALDGFGTRPAAFPGILAFAIQDRGTDWAIYTMRGTDTSPQRFNALDQISSSKISPVFSPDSSQLLFVEAISKAKEHIWRVNRTGQALMQLTNSESNDQYPCLMADNRILFPRTVKGTELWQMNADGGGQQRVRQYGGLCTAYPGPFLVESAGSPNYPNLALYRDLDENPWLTDPTTNLEYPSWSPDGRYLAYVRGKPYENPPPEIWIYDTMTDTSQQLTFADYTDADYAHTDPVWVSNTQLVYIRGLGSQRDIYTIDFVPGVNTTPRLVLSSPQKKFYLSWSAR